MSLIPCGYCGQRPREKLATLFWAWRMADGQRVAYRQQLCLEHFATNVLSVMDEPEPGIFRCVACHTPIEGDLDPVYATCYIPNRGRDDLQLALHSVCAVEIRNRATQGATRLPDRELPVEGQAPAPQLNNSVEAWNALGLRAIRE